LMQYLVALASDPSLPCSVVVLCQVCSLPLGFSVHTYVCISSQVMTPPLDALPSSARHHSGGAISQSALRCRHTVCGAFSPLAGPVKPSKDHELYKREETVTGHRGTTFPTGVRNACADAVFSFCPHHPSTHPPLADFPQQEYAASVILEVSPLVSGHSSAVHGQVVPPPAPLSPQPPRGPKSRAASRCCMTVCSAARSRAHEQWRGIGQYQAKCSLRTRNNPPGPRRC
jgi:hypothetical protein